MASEPYIIRLRDPWESSAGTVAASPLDGSARVTLRRWFNRPTGLDAGTRIVLAVARLEGLRRVLLNGQAIPGCEASPGVWHFALPSPLALRNQIVIELDAVDSALPDAIPRNVLAAGNVWLEIFTDSAGSKSNVE